MVEQRKCRFGSFRAVGVLAAVAAGAAGIAGLRWWHDYPVRHFAVVRDGVLYRSAQPAATDWPELRDEFGIRTVLDLRKDKPNAPWAVTERGFCRENGIRYVKMPVGPERLTDEQLKQVVEITTDPQCQPVLVHCEAGEVRTGVVVAAYRIVVQGWSYESALADFLRHRDHVNPAYAAYLKGLADGGGWRPGSGRCGG